MKHFAWKSVVGLVIINGLLVFNLAACGGGGANTSGSSASAPAAAVSSSKAASSEAASSEAASSEVASSGAAASAAGGEQVWGDWTVNVPGEFTLKGGDFIDENDKRYFSVKKSDFKYFDFNADGEENIKKHYEYNKKTYTNEQQDVKGTYGSNEWVGFQYSDGFGGFGFEAYATVGGELIRVSAAGFKFDSNEAKDVLGSLKHSANGAPAASTAAASSAAASSAAP